MKRFVGVALIGLVVAALSSAQTPGSTEQELKTLESDWKGAVVKRDNATLQRLYADDYLSTDSEGAVWNKADDIDIDTNGLFRLESFKLADLNVRVYGDVALVTGHLSLTGTSDQRELSGQFRFTDVFVKRIGRWQVVSSQLTPIAIVR